MKIYHQKVVCFFTVIGLAVFVEVLLNFLCGGALRVRDDMVLIIVYALPILAGILLFNNNKIINHYTSYSPIKKIILVFPFLWQIIVLMYFCYTNNPIFRWDFDMDKYSQAVAMPILLFYFMSYIIFVIFYKRT